MSLRLQSLNQKTLTDYHRFITESLHGFVFGFCLHILNSIIGFPSGRRTSFLILHSIRPSSCELPSSPLYSSIIRNDGISVFWRERCRQGDKRGKDGEKSAKSKIGRKWKKLADFCKKYPTGIRHSLRNFADIKDYRNRNCREAVFLWLSFFISRTWGAGDDHPKDS